MSRPSRAKPTNRPKAAGRLPHLSQPAAPIKLGFPSSYQIKDLVIVAKVGKANGVGGFFQIGLETDYPERFARTRELHLYPSQGDDATVRRFPVQEYQHRGSKHLLKLRGIDSPEEAKRIVHHWIAVPENDLVELEEGEYYHFQLEGLEVLDASRSPIGRLKEVLSLPAHEIYVVETAQGEVLVPAVEAYVHEVDIAKGWIALTLPIMDSDS